MNGLIKNDIHEGAEKLPGAAFLHLPLKSALLRQITISFLLLT
jgi:hypothetical protein